MWQYSWELFLSNFVFSSLRKQPFLPALSQAMSSVACLIFLKTKQQMLLRSSLRKHNIQAVKEVYFLLSWEVLKLRIEWTGKRITNTNLLCPLTTQKRLKLEPGLLEPTKSATGDRSLSNQKRFYTVPESVPMCSMPCYKSMSQPRIRTKHTIFACKSWFLSWILKRLILPCGPDRVRKEVNSR